uniref:SIR2_2 domain-containing protein n=1 Tax=Macrostomum lignano TaxID=282301 RepID=A0A1I8FKM4_9PLAT
IQPQPVMHRRAPTTPSGQWLPTSPADPPALPGRIPSDGYRRRDDSKTPVHRAVRLRPGAGGLVQPGPDDLYKNGLQRVNFLPFIPILKRHCGIVELGSGVDYRRLARDKDAAAGSSGSMRTYFLSGDADSSVAMETLWKRLCSAEAGAGPTRLRVFGRDVSFDKCKGGLLWASFDQLCCQPLAAAGLCGRVPALPLPVSARRSSAVAAERRRYADLLIDISMIIVISAAEPPESLFQPGDSLDEAELHRMRVLRDDLGVSQHGPNAESAGATIFTGEEEVFAHERTVSRLTEMMFSSSTVR